MATELPDFRVVLPARLFATAWLNAWQATGADDERPVLYRTVMVDALDGGVRLWATNTYVLFRSSLDTEGDPIGDDEAGPTLIAMDPDGRAKALMTYVMKDATVKDKPDATIEVYTARSETGAATLTPELQRGALVIEYESERLGLDLFEAEAPDWRKITGQDPKATKRLALGEITLKPLAGLRCAAGSGAPVEFSLVGERGPVNIRAGVVPEVRGVIMPVRIGEAA